MVYGTHIPILHTRYVGIGMYIMCFNSLSIYVLSFRMNETTQNTTHTTDTNNNALTQIKVQWIFTLLGIAFLLPWNSFISDSSYFESKSRPNFVFGTDVFDTHFNSDENDNTHSNDHHFMLWFGFLYNAFGVLTLIFLWIRSFDSEETLEDGNLSTAATTAMTNENHTKQMVTNAFLAYIIIMILNAVLALIPSPKILSSCIFQIISLLSAIICGISGAYLSIGIVTFTSTFPYPHWSIGPYITGQAMGGVLLSTLDLYMQYQFHSNSPMDEDRHHLYDNDTDMGTFVYFMTGSCFLSVCLYLYQWLEQQQLQQQLQQQHIIMDPPQTHDTEPFQVLENHDLSEPLLSSTVCTTMDHVFTEESTTSTAHDSWNVTSTTTSSSSSTHHNHQLDAWNRLKPIAISICTCFFTTITVFPSWITELKSTHANNNDNRWTNDLFVPLLIVLFNTFDFLGRIMAGYRMKKYDFSRQEESSTVSSLSCSLSTMMERFKIGSMARMALLPFFWCLNTTMTHEESMETHEFFKSDVFAILLSMIFAFTNGWISSGGFIVANLILVSEEYHLNPVSTDASSSTIPTNTTTTNTTTNRNHHDSKRLQEAASVILNFSVGLGLLGGSLFSFVFHSIGKWMVQTTTA